MKSDGHSLGLQVSRWPLALAHTQTPVSIGTRTHSRSEPSECLSWGQGTFECVLSQIVLKTKPGTNPSFEMNLPNCMLCLITYGCVIYMHYAWVVLQNSRWTLMYPVSAMAAQAIQFFIKGVQKKRFWCVYINLICYSNKWKFRLRLINLSVANIRGANSSLLLLNIRIVLIYNANKIIYGLLFLLL